MSIDSRDTMDFYRPMLVTAFNAITENNLPGPTGTCSFLEHEIRFEDSSDRFLLLLPNCILDAEIHETRLARFKARPPSLPTWIILLCRSFESFVYTCIDIHLFPKLLPIRETAVCP